MRLRQRIAALQSCLRELETAIITAYFTGSGRNPETDRAWLAKQCHKEYWGGYRAARDAVETALARGAPDERVVALMRYSAEEFGHYQAFAQAYAGIGDGSFPSLGGTAEELDWAENRALNRLRARQQNMFGQAGHRAYALTEGGAGALYEVGASLPTAKSPSNAMIAAACLRVMREEESHREQGLRDLHDDPANERLIPLLAAQIEPRLQMRNAQFGKPWLDEQVHAQLRLRLSDAGFDVREFHQTPENTDAVVSNPLPL